MNYKNKAVPIFLSLAPADMAKETFKPNLLVVPTRSEPLPPDTNHWTVYWFLITKEML